MINRIMRVLRHWWQAPDDTRAITPEMQARLQKRVTASEQCHSGEIRLYVETSLPLSYLWRDAPIRQLTRQRALTLFGKLRVWDTAHNNGVLIYLLLAERAIEVVADRGLNEAVDSQYWQTMVARMGAALRQGQFEEGLKQALEEVSALLVEHFPLQAGEANPNELPDSPVLR